jgi:hypothetical protein
MTDVAKVRALVDYVVGVIDPPMAVDPDAIAITIMALDSHALLRDYDGTPAEYHARVQRAYGEALRKVMGDD